MKVLLDILIEQARQRPTPKKILVRPGQVRRLAEEYFDKTHFGVAYKGRERAEIVDEIAENIDGMRLMGVPIEVIRGRLTGQ